MEERALDWNCEHNFDSVRVIKVTYRKVNRMSKEQSGFGFQFRLTGPRAEEMAVRGKATHTDWVWTVGSCEYL